MAGIKKNFLYSSILTTANYLFPLLTFPYVSRVLGVTNIGIVNFIDSVIGYFMLFSALGVNIVGVREVAKYKNDKNNLSKVYSGIFWLITITTSIALIILCIITVYVDQLRQHWQLMSIGALKLLMNYMLIEWLYKGLEEFQYITIRTLIVKSLYVIGVFVFVRQESDYPVYFLLLTMMVVLNAVINLLHSRKYVNLSIHSINLFQYIKPLFIIGVYQILNSMYISLNVTYLGFVSGETEVGYYTTAFKLHHILIALFTAFTGVMLPRMSSLLADNKIEEFKKLINKANSVLFSFSVPLIIFTIVYAPIIIRIVSGIGYEGAIIPMRLMMPLILIIGYEQILVIQTLMPLKKDNAILNNSIVGATVGLFLNILLIPSLDSVGAALVWLCSEIVVLCCAQHYVIKYVKIRFPWKILLKNVLICIPLCIMLGLIYTKVENPILSIGASAIFCIIYFLFSNLFISRNEEIYHLLFSFSLTNKRN